MPASDCGLRILIVEDHKSTYLILCDYLKEALGESVGIKWAQTAHDAVRFLVGDEFDVCLLDYSLEDGDATDIMESVAGEFFDTPVVIVSSHEDEAHISQAMQVGADNYLVKGHFDSDELGRTIKYAIHQKKKINTPFSCCHTSGLFTGCGNAGFLFGRTGRKDEKFAPGGYGRTELYPCCRIGPCRQLPGGRLWIEGCS